jgi:putative redox protein
MIMSVEMDVVYEGDLHCSATHGPSGLSIATDAPLDNGGRGSAFSPTDLVTAALSACMLTIMGLYAKKAGLDIEGTRVHATKGMTALPVRRIGKITIVATLPAGRGFTDEQKAEIERAAAMCPVKKSLHPDIEIAMEFIYPD